MIQEPDGTWKKAEPEKLQTCFSMFDLNGDGFVSKEELVYVFAMIGVKVKKTSNDER